MPIAFKAEDLWRKKSSTRWHRAGELDVSTVDPLDQSPLTEAGWSTMLGTCHQHFKFRWSVRIAQA